MTIYIGTIIAGRNAGKAVTAMRFANRREFYQYCDRQCAMSDTSVTASMSIGELCDAIADKGPGIGSRYHKRITRSEALGCRVIYS